MKRAEKRDHLVEVASSLFNRLGYRATGVDHVIAEAGIAKTTLYRHFESKEALIVAVLDRFDERYRDRMRAFVEDAESEPVPQLLATFDFLEGWFKDRTFYGCPFVAAAGEYGDPKSPVFQAAARHKQLTKAYFETLARAARLASPAEVAEDIHLLHEGATAVAHLNGEVKAAQRAKALASLRLGLPAPRPARPKGRGRPRG